MKEFQFCYAFTHASKSVPYDLSCSSFSFTETTAVQNTTTSSIILTTSTATISVPGTSFTSAATTSITKPASSISMTSTIQPRTWEEMTEKEKQLEVLGPYPCKAPAGLEWIPNGWKLAPVHVATTDNSSPNTSFEELFLEKIQAVGGGRTNGVKWISEER